MGGLRGPGRGTVVTPVALLAIAPAAGSIGSVGSDSQAAEPDSPAAASSPAVEAPPSPAAGPTDETEARGRVIRLGAAALGLPVDEVDLFTLEWNVIPGDPSRWAGGKVLRIGGTEAAVAWANLDTGEVIDGAAFETRSRAGGANEGRIDPTLARLLDAAAPAGGLTVAVLVRGGPREAIIAGVKARYPNVTFTAEVPDTGADALNIEIRSARRTAYREAAQRALTPVIARATALGMGVEYAARFAPLVYVTGTPDAIRQLATESPVIRIMASTGTRAAMASAGPTDQATWSDTSGFRGAGSRIAVVEYENVNWSATGLSTIPSSRRVSYSTTGLIDPGNHPTRVMGTIANQTSGSRGIAPDAFYISSSTGDGSSGETRDFRILQAIDTAVDPALGNADVVNLSIVQDTPAGASALTAYVDEVARSGLGVHVTTAGGNAGHCNTTSGMEVLNRIRPPGDAWNSITVGGIDDKNTSSWSDDTVWNHCYLDPPGRTFKPEMSAPAVSISAAGLGPELGNGVASPTHRSQARSASSSARSRRSSATGRSRRTRSCSRRPRSTERRTPARWMPPSTTVRASARSRRNGRT